MFWQNNVYDEVTIRQLDNNIFRLGVSYAFGADD
jgi:hypothetical protein